ncbi:sugar porter family MFS transporter [Brevibacterium samyangense]|uniref:Sugar porter family MFS transporter n=1 Tax=Brevibacterium samyangense TaxID=366888 RepID=A0ABN2T9B1_9MICO
MKGFAVSSALLGCMIGAYFAGLAVGPWDLVLWRVIGGLGVGAASVIAPAYIAEISPASVRGRLGSMQQLAIVCGIFVSLLVDYMMALDAGSANAPYWFGIDAWRWMFIAEIVPAIAYGALALTVPESPRFLVQKGRTDEARTVLSRILVDGIDTRIEEICRTLDTERRQSFRDILRPGSKNVLPIVWVGIVLSVFQQFVGINVIFYYSNTLWQSVGFSENDSFTITVITSVTNIVVTIVAILLIDRIGRRLVLLVGSAGMFLSLGLMTVCFTAGVDRSVTETVALLPGYDITALIAANAFVVFFGASWGPGVWVLLGEIFNNRIRAIALGVAAAAQWLANFAISTTFPAMADVGLWFAYGFYSVCALASFFFVARFVRETKGRELEDME